jgi:hypothetical protein
MLKKLGLYVNTTIEKEITGTEVKQKKIKMFSLTPLILILMT